jgi:hypothetical protein
MLDTRGIARILNAVGRGSTPPGLDRVALRRNLESGAIWYRTKVQLRPSERAKRQRQLRGIKIAAKKLASQLSDEGAWRELSAELPLNQDCPRATLKDLLEAIDRALLRRDEGAGTKNLFEARSPFEWLVGNHLPRVFKHHFNRQPGFSRQGDGTPSGPYIRFAEQVLTELKVNNRGRPYKLGAIARAFDDARHGRVRSRRNVIEANVGQT